ncbi:MAG: hypothetical protein ABR511_09015, partial [Acidimicrobiales bacterium]
ITTEVGPGSNISRLDETAILNTVADRADQILAAAKPLSGQANDILTAAKSIDGHVTDINNNAQSINGTAKSINGTFTALAPVVNNIKGTPGSIDHVTPFPTAGVTAINIRVDNILRSVSGIRSDLDQVNTDVTSINGEAAGIDFGVNNLVANVLANPLGTVKGLLCGLAPALGGLLGC